MSNLPAIAAALDAVEAEESVVILLAVESGSRAWGFARDTEALLVRGAQFADAMLAGRGPPLNPTSKVLPDMPPGP